MTNYDNSQIARKFHMFTKILYYSGFFLETNMQTDYAKVLEVRTAIYPYQAKTIDIKAQKFRATHGKKRPYRCK